MAASSARALHYVLKIGDRAKNIHFFKNVLGMQVSESHSHKSIYIPDSPSPGPAA